MLHDFIFEHQPFQTHDPTQPIENKNFWPTIPTQANPTHGSIQPTDNSATAAGMSVGYVLYTISVPQTHNSIGDQTFSAAGPRVWNSLPPHLRQDMNFARFQHKLKTFLFGC